MTQDSPLVSVVVTAYNAGDALVPCLRSLAAQTGFSPGELEIVLVDDRSTDHAVDRALALGLKNLTHLRMDRYKDPLLTARQQALHEGILKARGETVFVTDADARAEPDWVQKGLERLERTGAPAVAGPVEHLPAKKGFFARAAAAFQTLDSLYYIRICRLLSLLGLPFGLVFGNFGFRRELYRETGGIPAAGFSLIEDFAFAGLMRRHGKRPAFETRPRVRVGAAPGFRAVVKRSVRTSSGGFSFVFLALLIWMGLMAGLLLAAPIFGGIFATLLLIRYFAGVTILLNAAAWGGSGAGLFLAPFYEPLALALSVWLLVRIRFSRTVHWGGIDYER